MTDYRRLFAAQRAQALSLAVQVHSRRIRERTYPGLCARLRRTAAGVEAGAMSAAAGDTVDRLAAAGVALDAARELECHLEMARDLGAIPRREAVLLLRQLMEMKRLLRALGPLPAASPAARVTAPSSAVVAERPEGPDRW